MGLYQPPPKNPTVYVIRPVSEVLNQMGINSQPADNLLYQIYPQGSVLDPHRKRYSSRAVFSFVRGHRSDVFEYDTSSTLAERINEALKPTHKETQKIKEPA